MIYFCKSGLMVLKDSDGKMYYFDPENSLKSVASYIWSQDAMKEFQNEFEPQLPNESDVVYIEPQYDETHRLRAASIMDDKYYSE